MSYSGDETAGDDDFGNGIDDVLTPVVVHDVPYSSLKWFKCAAFLSKLLISGGVSRVDRFAL